MLKHTRVVGSGVTSYLHARAGSHQGMAVFGALIGLTALFTLFVGITFAG